VPQPEFLGLYSRWPQSSLKRRADTPSYWFDQRLDQGADYLTSSSSWALVIPTHLPLRVPKGKRSSSWGVRSQARETSV